VYRDLPSHAVDWSMIEEDLSHRPGFSGMIEVIATGISGRVFYLESQVIASHLFGPQGFQRVRASSFVAQLLHDTKAKLSVYAMDAAVVRPVVATPSWDVQRSVVANPAVFFEWLDQLELNAGTASIELLGSRGSGFVLFEYGNKVLICFQAATPGASAVFGMEALNMHKMAARWPDATLHLLARDTTTAGFSASFGASSAGIAESSSGAPKARAAAPSGTQSSDKTPSGTVLFPDMIAAWQAVLEFTEYRMDHARGQGTFDQVWREVCLELVDRYPQLDPFLEDIRYQNGVLSMHRPSGTGIEALSVAYLRTLGKLGIQIEAVRPLLKPIRDRHQPVWRAAGLEVVCPL
jgi:hypothetical protein